MKMRKRIQKITIFLGIFIILILCVGFLFSRSDTFLNWVEKRLESELKNRITEGYTADIGTIKGSIFGNVAIDGVKITKAGEPVIATRKVLLKYKLLPLLARKFEVKTLTVNAPEIHARHDPDGKLNLSNIFRESPSDENATQFRFAIKEVQFSSGTIDYVDTERNLDIRIDGIKMDVSGPLDAWNHTGEWRIVDGSLTFNGAETRINNFEGGFLFTPTNRALGKLLLTFGNSSLEVNGNFAYQETGKPWEISLDLLQLDVADVAQFFGEGTKLEGVVKGGLQVTGTDSGVVGALSLETPTVSMTQTENDRQIALTTLKIDADFTSEPTPTFILKNFSAQVADGTLTGKGRIGLQDGLEGGIITELQQLTTHPLVYEGECDATDMKLGPLLAMFVQLPEYLTDSTGHLSGNATVNGNSKDFSTFKLNSTIAITETILNEVALADSTLRCRIDAGELKVDGTLDETEITVTGPFPLAESEFLDIHIARINFDDLMKIVNSADLGGIGEYTAKLSADGTLTGTMKIPNASFNDIPIGALVGNLDYEDGQVLIENGLLTKNTKNDLITPYQSRATISGVVDIEGDFPAAFSIIADPVYVQHYPRVLLGAKYPVDGEIRGELKLGGTLINLDGSADFSVTEGVAWGIHLDPLTLPLRIEDYHITLPNFEVTTRSQKVTLNISVDPNGDFDFLLESDAPVNFQALAQAAQISDFPFDGQFDVRVAGTLKKPGPLDFQIKLDFADITLLDSDRGTKHPLGDASLLGKLVELKNVTGEPDRFDFIGNGFNGQIQGYISTATDNPYRFIVESQTLEVTPILRILHPALEAVTGTAAGRAEINGTVAALAPTGESDEQRVYPYDVNIDIATSRLHYGKPPKTPFTNAEPIRVSLRDDKWTIETFSLRTSDDKSPFIELTGSFDAKSEGMVLDAKADGFALAPFGTALGLPLDMLQAGTGRYALKVTGTSKQPEVVVDWTLPTLGLKTEVGDIRISDARGALVYRDNLIRFERTALNLLGNRVDIGGEIAIDPEAINNSQVNFSVNAPDLELTTLAALIEDSIAGGTLETTIDITGTLAETAITIHAQTVPERPIRLIPDAAPITVEGLQAEASFNSAALHIRSVAARGRIGDGTYRIQGDAAFFMQAPSKAAMQFAIDVSVSELDVSDFASVLSEAVPVHGTISGHAKLNGTGTQQHQMSIVGEISKLNLRGYDSTATNTAPLRFRSERGDLAVHFPLALKSPEMTATTQVNITGTFDAPEITAVWTGYINEIEWNGDIQYDNERITIVEIALKNRAGTSTITGVIPFNLAFTQTIDLSDRFPDEPIAVHFRGSELPLNFFPGMDRLFSATDGTVDIDLALQGTSRDPYITGTVSLEALELQLRHFHEPIRNMKIKFAAREDAIDLTELDFDMGSGYCRLQQAQLALDGLVPKHFTLTGLRFELFPLGSTVRQYLPPEVQEVKGHLSTTLSELTVPFDSFLTKGENGLFPQIRAVPSLADIAAVSNAKLSINSVQLAFKVLNRHYDFQYPQPIQQYPQPIQIVLSAGIVRLPNAFTLADHQHTFPIRQTFTAEDEKPEGVVGDVDTIENARTTLSIDADSQWSVDGEFKAALRLNNFDVSVLTDTWPAPYRIKGALSGSLQVSGTSENPKITLRRHKAEPAELYFHDVPIDLRWRIRYQNGKWEISKTRYVEVDFGENLLTFSWEMPYRFEIMPFLTALQQSPETVWQELRQTDMDGILDIEIRDLDSLSAMVPGLRAAAGTGKISVVLTGSVETPQAEGAVLFNNIGFEMPEAGITAKGITGSVMLSEQGAAIKELRGIMNEGDFSITGSVMAPADGRVWENPPRMDLQTSISSALFEQDGNYQIKLGAKPTQLHLQGEFDDPSLKGNLNISHGYYEQNWETVIDWFSGTSVSEVDVILDYPILRYLDLNIDIDIPDNFRVLSSIMGPTDIEISSSGGKLIGPIQNPVFNGTVSVIRGKIGLVPQTFEFIEGSRITNRSTVEFDPELHIFLRTPNRIRGVLPRDQSTVDLEINASLTGTLENPEFVLSAANTTEILSHEEIMSFLVRNAAFSRAFGGFTFNFHRPHHEARSISAEYQLGDNMSIKMENNEKGEYGVGFEIKGRF